MGKPPKKKKPKRKPSAYNKHVGREMRAGKTMKQAAASWKKKGSKSTKRVSPKKRSNPTGGTRNMTKNSFNMNKIYGLARKVALFAPAIGRAMGPGTAESKIDGIVADYTGYAMGQGDWNWERLKRGWMPFIATSMITKAIPALNKLIRSIF